jgi:tryptophan synthase
VDYPAVLGFVREARSQGLKAPVLLMGSSLDLIHLYDLKRHSGYYNPLLSYGEEKAIQDAKEAGANGFIMVDLPPEEAVIFRGKCTKAGYVARDASSQRRGSFVAPAFLTCR